MVLTSAARDAALLVRLAPPELGANHDEIIRKAFQPRSGRAERLVSDAQPRLLNSVYGGGEPLQGQRVKVVEIQP